MNLLNMIRFELKLMAKTPVMGFTFYGYPVILTLIIGYLTQNSFGSGISSYEYYAISMLIFLNTNAGLSSVYNFIDQPIKQGNLRVIYTPIRTTSIYLSQVICGTIFCMGGIIFSMTLFKILFNMHYNGNAFFIFMALATLSFMSNALGVFLCTIINEVGPINMIFNVISISLCVLGGAFFSIESLGKIPANLAKISPVKWILDGVLNSMYDNSNTLILITIALNLILGVLLIALTKRTFKTERYV